MRMKPCVLLLILSFGLMMTALSQAKPTEAAQQADATWLALVDAAQYAQSWQAAATAFRNAVSEQKWEQAMQSVRAPLGKLTTRKPLSATFTKSLPGAPDGSYVVSTFQSSFEHKESAMETVVATLDKDSTWRITGYFIK